MEHIKLCNSVHLDVKPRSHKEASSTNYARGLHAEHKAIHFFTAKEYVCLSHRLLTPFGEIDLLFSQGTQLVFVEVKQRQRLALTPWALRPRQINRLKASAAFVLENLGQSSGNFPWDSVQFDFFGIDPQGSIHHIPNVLTVDTSEELWAYP